MSNSWQDYSFRSTIATKLVRNDHARPAATGSQELAKEAYSSEAIAFRLDQDVNDCAGLIHGTPQIMLHSVDLQEHFIQEPLVAQLRSSALQLGCIANSELIAPAPDRLVTQLDSPLGHHQFHFSQAYGEVEVQLHALRNDFFRKPITAIEAA